ncbi:STAS domain-containing protein [Azoarcus sp. L1K30]|uniref:STAS domain-containing protein n=1 Tax=Azoarcus sp. L1K30 TaxID=2820277 RepID=UPI001B810CB6|nr:STAS domain-containing protein [Azoarcus sp. L1K30]
MALSFFGKKPNSAPGDEHAPAAPDVRRSQGPRTELSTLDFSGGDVNRALAQCAGMVEVQEVGAGIGAIYEEAAVLYANGNVAEAERVLNSVLDDSANTAGEGLWMMLLDLYRLTGQRERFESRVLDYATRFERSPPPWEDLSCQPEKRRSEVAPLVNLAGNLSGQAATQFQQICVIGRKSGAIRIDLGRLRAVDETGSSLLSKALAQLASDHVRVSLLNAAQLVNMLSGQVVAGRNDNRDTWLLMLELLQYTGEHERFEDLAVDYAVTFEESPPSWEYKAQQQAAVAATALDAAVTDDDAFRFEGELTGASNDAIRKLAARASGQQVVKVDCSRLKRIDFVGAGTLFNVLATLQSQGKLVVMQNVNAMVGALLRVMSVDQVAQVTLRP